MNARPLVVIEKTAAIPMKDALKMVRSFTKSARDRMDNQGLDLTNRERESAVSEDVLEHLVMIQSALEDELNWLHDGRGSGKDSQGSSPHKAANKASRSGKTTKNDKNPTTASASKSSSANEGKKRKFSDGNDAIDTDPAAPAPEEEADAPPIQEEESGGLEEGSSAKKDKKQKKEKKEKKRKVDEQ